MLPLLLALLWSRAAFAGQLAYEADAACPSKEEVARRVASKASQSQDATISVRREGTMFVGRLAAGTGEAAVERRVEGRTCDAVIEALVLVLALDRPTPAESPAPEAPPEPAAVSDAPAAPPDAPTARPAKRPRIARFGAVAGAAVGTFFGIPNTRARLGGALIVGRDVIGLRAEFDWEPGSTEYGLDMHRFVLGVGAETIGRIRLGLGVHLPYTFVLRATQSSSFVDGMIGDIGGFGLGGHASLWVDVIRLEAVTFMLGGRGDLETYFTGSSRQASAAVGALF